MQNSIRRLRLERGLTMQELANRIGTSKSQIDKLEKSERRLTVDWMRRLSNGLECDVIALLPETDAASSTHAIPSVQSQRRDLPVMGAVRGGMDGLFFDNGKVMETVNRPANLIGVGNAFAVYAVGDSMEPRFFAGELLYVNPNRPLSRGCFVAIEMQDGQGLVKQFLRQDDASITLHQFNPAQDLIIAKSQIKNLYRIVGSSEQL